MEKLVVVDLTRLKKLTHRLLTSTPLELKLVKLYSYDVTTEADITTAFANYVLGVMHYKKGSYKYNELNAFFNSKRYLNTVEKFIGYIDYLVTKDINPRFDNIIFNQVIRNDEELYLVEFKVINYE